MLNIELQSDMQDLNRLAAAVAEFAVDEQLSESMVMKLTLVAEELFANFVNYGDHEKGTFEISVRATSHEFCIVIQDSGRPFNPLESQPPDLQSPLVDREIGGLGIHFTKQVCSHMDYEHVNRRNVIRLKIQRDLPEKST